jgi:hypothetical protein
MSVISISINAQQTKDEINPSLPNLKYIEHLIKLKIDSIRVSKGLPPFLNDSILYLSSIDHAQYLTQSKSLTHYQLDSRRKRTYHERAVKYGAEDYYVSENLAKVSVGYNEIDGNEIKVYEHIANIIVNKWVNSNANYANIIAPSHSIVGIGSWFEKEAMEISVAINFAAVAGDYKPHHYPGLFPYSKPVLRFHNDDLSKKPDRKYDWGINPSPDRKIQQDYRKISKRVNTLGVVNRNDSIFVVFNNARRMGTLFENRNDGLAMEIIPHEIYSCHSINKISIRRYDEFNIKGILTKPVYRDQLLETIIDKKSKLKVDLKYLGTIPDNLKKSDYSINLVVIKSNRIADIITFNETPTQIFNSKIVLAPVGDKPKTSVHYIPNLRRDTLMLRIYFDQNRADVKTHYSDTISKWVKDKQIQRAAVYAYASIEGTIEINKNLMERRANEVIAYFSPSDGRTVNVVKVTRENWYDFFKEIVDSRHNFLKQLDHERVREYVNQKKNSRELEPVLARQRFADLKILAYKTVNDISIDGLALSEYKTLYEKIVKECKGKQTPYAAQQDIIKRMEQIHLFLLNRNTSGRVSWHTLEQLPIALYSGEFDYQVEPLAKLYYNKNRFKLVSQGDYMSQSDSLNTLKELIRFPNPDPIVAYNYFALLFNSGEIDSFEPFYIMRTLHELKDLINRLEYSDFDREILDHLKLYYHFKSLEQDFFINRFGEQDADIKASLDFVFNHYKNKTLPKKVAQELSMFFSAFKRYDDAQMLIEPFVFSPNPCKESFVLYLKYYYSNPRIKQNTDFYQLLKDASDIFTNQEWCNLFHEKWPINIQVLDHEPLLIMYCNHCSN